MKFFLHPGWYGIRHEFRGERTTAYKKFATNDELQTTIDSWTELGSTVLEVFYIANPTVIRVNGVPLEKK